MKLKVINIEGKKVDDIEISEKIFSLKPNKVLIQSLIDFQKNNYIVDFKTDIKGVAPGQSAVFYQDDLCLGGGVISKAF